MKGNMVCILTPSILFQCNIEVNNCNIAVISGTLSIESIINRQAAELNSGTGTIDLLPIQ